MDEKERILNPVAAISILTGVQNVPGTSRENAEETHTDDNNIFFTL
jgi:hypothetical protein